VPSGTGSYRLKVSYYANNALASEQTVNNATSGVFWANWSGVANLQHGGQYSICVQGQYTMPNDSLWISDGPNSCSMGTMLGRRSHTTIDRSKPAVAVTAAGGDATTKSGSIPVSIAFSDDVAGPYPSTWTCVTAGSDPCTQFDFSADCSAPGTPGKSTTFSCTADASQLPDGPVTVCARSADASVPDNPSSATQTSSAAQANISEAQCDTVTARPERPGAGPRHPRPRHPRPGRAESRHDPRHGRPSDRQPHPPGAQADQDRQGEAARRGRSRRPGRAALAQPDPRQKVYSRLSVGLSEGQTKQRLRLPKRLKAGTYTVKIAFKASGAGWAATGTTKVSARR
jgi:hypothetical protein